MGTSIPGFFLLGAVLVFGTAPSAAQDASPNPPKTIKVGVVRTMDGAMMYHQYCAVCHGDEGRGDGPVASALRKAPADLTRISQRNGGKFPSLRVMRMIEGADLMASHGSRAMPIWGNIFRAEANPAVASLRVNALLKFVAELQAN